MRAPRKCRRFWCTATRENFCCSDCPLNLRCASRCLNTPRRCGLSGTPRDAKVAVIVPSVAKPDEKENLSC